MDKPINSQLSQKSKERMQRIHDSYAAVSVEGEGCESEKVDSLRTVMSGDSGYSSDVDGFVSPMSPMSSIDTTVSLEEYKTQVDEALREYFVTSDVMEFIDCIAELNATLFAYEIVMRSISLSLDRGDRERELVSRLFAVGCGSILSEFSITKGFEKLFSRVSDLSLDCPNARNYLSKFLARAIVDEVVPPVILKDVIMLEHGADIIRETGEILNMPHSLELTEHIWGAGAASLEELSVTRNLLLDAIREYYNSHDVEECLKCVKELGAPHYLHELVKKAVEVAMDGDEKRMELAKRLLEEGCARGVIPHHQLVLGVRRLEKALPELMLDVPFAKKDMEEMVSFLLKADLLKEEELKQNWSVC